MNAIELLTQDHKVVKALFRKFEKAKKPETQLEIAQQVFTELAAHTAIEEEIFYPAYKEAAKQEGEELVAESLEEHHVVKMLIEEMQALDPSDEAWEAKFTVLTENVEHHAEEEEKEMFPDAKKRLAKQLDALGKEMESRKSSLVPAKR
jgi:hemerythrin superfamily protein